MEVGDIPVDLGEVVSVLPPPVIDKIGVLATILKAVGIAFIVYVIYVVIKLFLGIKNTRRLKSIERKVNLIDKKIDFLVEDNPKKVSKKSKSSKKK